MRIALFAALGGFLFGYDLGLIGPALEAYKEAGFELVEWQYGLVVSAAKWGAVLGTFLGGALMLYYGRQPSVAINAVFFVTGPVIMASLSPWWCLAIGRVFIGLGVGVSAVVVPAYLGEIAPAKVRGTIVESYELMLCLGMAAAQLFDMAVYNLAGNWRWMVGAPAVPGALLLLAPIILPESPRWLVVQGRLDEALAILHRIYTNERLPGGVQQSTAEVEHELLLLWSGVEQEQAAAAERRAGLGRAPRQRRAREGGAWSSMLARHKARRFHQLAGQAGAGAAEMVDAAVAAHGGLNGAVHGDEAAVKLGTGEQPPGAGLEMVPLDQAQEDAFASAALQEVDLRDDGCKPSSLPLEQPASAAALLHAVDAGRGAQGPWEGMRGSSTSGMEGELPAPHTFSGSGHAADADADGVAKDQARPSSAAAAEAGGGGGSGADVAAAGGETVVAGPAGVCSVSMTSAQSRTGLGGFLYTAAVMLWDLVLVARGQEKRAFLVALCLAAFNQAMGSTVVIEYAPKVLGAMDVTSEQVKSLLTVSVSFSKLIGVAAAMLLVDRWGRRPLLLLGSTLCAGFLGLTALGYWLSSVPLLIAGLDLFIGAFSLSWAGIFWVLLSEIFSMGAKSPACSAATALLFTAGAITDLTFPLMFDSGLGGGTFLVYAGVAAASSVFVYFMVPETKGRTLQEVQQLMGSAPAPGQRLMSQAPSLLLPGQWLRSSDPEPVGQSHPTASAAAGAGGLGHSGAAAAAGGEAAQGSMQRVATTKGGSRATGWLAQVTPASLTRRWERFEPGEGPQGDKPLAQQPAEGT